jgi:CHASE1-domain containing sensor protein
MRGYDNVPASGAGSRLGRRVAEPPAMRLPRLEVPQRDRYFRRHVAVVLTAVCGALASLATFILILSSEHRVAEIDFASKAKSFLEVINADLSDADTLLYTLGAYVETNERGLSREKFERFSHVLHDRVAGVRDVGFAPRIVDAERAAFERRVRSAGIDANYLIAERDARHELRRADERQRVRAGCCVARRC